jgi:2-amino-4-hydroxy-6-hydroxymethyldihydropteridine diphosphokinase
MGNLIGQETRLKGTEMIYEAYLALGTNIGDRKKNLLEAIDRINELDEIKVESTSKIYETEPVGYLDQDNYLNMVILIRTDKSPVELLKNLQKIEGQMKRTREIHWGPRTIDLDILLFDALTINLPDLVIPHPRMLERAFVLIPLKDVYNKKMLAGYDINLLINSCKDRNGVKLYSMEDKNI